MSGTLHYVTDYTGFSGEPELQEGNYLCLRFDTDEPEDVITVELQGGLYGPVELDSDRNCVFKVTDPRHQRIRVVTTRDGESYAEIYFLRQLTLEEAE